MRPINLYIFIHDDIPSSTASTLLHDYFALFTKEITSFTGRRFIFNKIRHVPGITDFKYTSKHENGDIAALSRWAEIAQRFQVSHNLLWGKTERYILVTKDSLTDTGLGIAYLKEPPLIACIKYPQVIAHEVGHSFNGTHEHAMLSVDTSGAVCESFIYAKNSNTRAKCFRYTQANRDRIAAFLSDAP